MIVVVVVVVVVMVVVVVVAAAALVGLFPLELFGMRKTRFSLAGLVVLGQC